MRFILILTFLSLQLVGCADWYSDQASSNWYHRQQCLQYGFIEGSPEFAKCCMKLDQEDRARVNRDSLFRESYWNRESAYHRQRAIDERHAAESRALQEKERRLQAETRLLQLKEENLRQARSEQVTDSKKAPESSQDPEEAFRLPLQRHEEELKRLEAEQLERMREEVESTPKVKEDNNHVQQEMPKKIEEPTKVEPRSEPEYVPPEVMAPE